MRPDLFIPHRGEGKASQAAPHGKGQHVPVQYGLHRLDTVVDGIEPVERPSDSIQFELFDYVYHQILRKDAEWVARDLFREHYRRNAETVAHHVDDPAEIGCLLLITSSETTLDGLIERPLDEGDVLSNANTVIHLGKIREGTRFRRAMYVTKHRGSACTDEIIPYSIGDKGLVLE